MSLLNIGPGLKNGASRISRIDIVCGPEPALHDQIGTNYPLQTFKEGELRLALDHFGQLALKPDHKVRVFAPSGLHGSFGLVLGSIIVSQLLDNVTSKRSLIILKELGNIPKVHVTPQEAVRKVFHNCDGADRIVIVTDTILIGSLAAEVYRKVFGLKSKEKVPEPIERPDNISHISIYTQVQDSARRHKILRPGLGSKK